MNWYLTIECSNTVENPYVATLGDLAGYEDWQLWQGDLVTGWRGDAWLKADPDNDGEPDDVLQNLYGLPVFSGRLRRRIEREPIGGIQFLPITVLNSKGVGLGDFAIANVVDVVDALHLGLSAYQIFESDYFIVDRRGKLRGISEPVLRGKALTGHHLIRPKGYAIHLYCSERFKTLFESEGFTGFSFRQLTVVP